nr:hypothetical protein [Tanacetum cinerariifolium]
NVEDTSSKAMVAIDGAGFDWSYMADDEAPINMAFMAFLDSEREDQGYFNSGCSRHMTGNISYITDFKEFDGGYVAFGGGAKVGKITSKGKIITGNLDFKDVYFVKELQFNLFSVSQMCDKKNNVLFTDIECFVLSPDFKLADESHVLLKVHRKNNMYSVDMKNIVPKKDLTCLIRVLVVKPHFKTLYELFKGITPALSFMRPFGFHVTILNTLDHLGKFDGKSDEGFFFGYSTTSKTFRVYNTRTRKVEKNLQIKFLENKPIIAGKRASFDAGQSSMETRPCQDYILMPLLNDGSLFDSSSKDSDGENKHNNGPSTESKIDNQQRPNSKNNTKDVNIVGPSINTASSNINNASPTVNTVRQSDDFFGADNDMRSLDEVEPMLLLWDSLFIRWTLRVIFLYGRIEEEVYVCQPLGFEDLDYPDKFYKVEKALYGLHQAPRACQDKYIDEILRKFKYTDVKPANTLMDKEKALLKDSDGDDVDVYLYMSMIMSLMHLTSSRPDIMLAICTCAKFQCKKLTVIATSTTKAEYVATASYCGQVLWIQNQLLDYRIMSPKATSQAAIERLITQRVNAALEAERARQVNVWGQRSNDNEVGGPSEYAEERKFKFATATLQGRALTWWNSQVATKGLEAANRITWTEMKKLMTEKFCPAEEIQRMEHEL